ncbi:hypothetical protein K458DRAFT_391067 [Lentithecium fluviatile CBS 122367]|uniref:Uncharacterized protein n=1 Tax=Lentithecium fluviatile CBS 122367 TaxID=1168545 RepID=A0A6G1IV91_9PLEO|nr:hypothetical protein K458DRAFT_391067 [Lentithecium fluviatile CBS 122367]
MADLDLQSLAPRGTATWHSDDDNRASTIDLILATPELANEDRGNVDAYCEYIMELVTPAVEKHVPLAKPSLYAKRWWNEDLIKL